MNIVVSLILDHAKALGWNSTLGNFPCFLRRDLPLVTALTHDNVRRHPECRFGGAARISNALPSVN